MRLPHEHTRALKSWKKLPLGFKHGLVPAPELVRKSQEIVRKDTKQGPGDGGCMDEMLRTRYAASGSTYWSRCDQIAGVTL